MSDDPKRLLRCPIGFAHSKLGSAFRDSSVLRHYFLGITDVDVDGVDVVCASSYGIPLDRGEAHAIIDALYDYQGGYGDFIGRSVRIDQHNAEVIASSPAFNPPPALTVQPPPEPAPAREGFVYVMWDIDDPDAKKIGWTIHVPRRVDTISSEKRIKRAGFFYVRSDDAPRLERLMHKYYAFFKIKGEWFSLPKMNYAKFTAAIIDAGSSFHPPANDDFTAKHIYMEEPANE